MSEYGGNNLQKQRQSFILSGTDKFLHYPCTGEVKNKAKASLNLPLTILARFSCLGKICSCTSFHLSRFMNKFSSWNRYKRPFQIRGVFSGSWSFVFFLQIGQFHVSARTRSSYPTQVDYKNWWVFLEDVFFSLAAVWAERSEHFQFSFDFDLGYISDHFLASCNCTVPSFLMWST